VTSGAEFIVGALAAEGVGHLFMVPGGHNDPFMTPMVTTPGVSTTVAAFEGGAAYMADGYARSLGHLGVAFGIGGPGILNMATALSSARADRVPVLAISGEVPSDWEGRGGFQDATGAPADDVDAMRAVCGASVRVETASMLGHQLRGLLLHAYGQRTPVHLSVPLDVQRATVDEPWVPIATSLRAPRILDGTAWDEAMGRLAQCRTVAVLVGPGLRIEDDALLREVAERWDIPVTTTLGAKGALDERHPLSMGVFGYGGSRWATELIWSGEVDALIVAGSALSQRDTLQWDRRMLPRKVLIHVDADPELPSRTWPQAFPVIADPRSALEALRDADGSLAIALERGRAARRDLYTRVTSASARNYDTETRGDSRVPMHPARVIATARTVLPDDAVALSDSGAHRAFAAQHWQATGPRTYLSATNIGPMGAAIPMGVGAAAARPHRPHIVFTSDGCMLMHGNELHPAARDGHKVIVVVLNNHSYGNIWYRASTMGPGEVSLTDIGHVGWARYGEALGVESMAVEQPDDLVGIFERALAHDGPVLVDARTDKTVAKPDAPWVAGVRDWEDDH